MIDNHIPVLTLIWNLLRDHDPVYIPLFNPYIAKARQIRNGMKYLKVINHWRKSKISRKKGVKISPAFRLTWNVNKTNPSYPSFPSFRLGDSTRYYFSAAPIVYYSWQAQVFGWTSFQFQDSGLTGSLQVVSEGETKARNNVDWQKKGRTIGKTEFSNRGL